MQRRRFLAAGAATGAAALAGCRSLFETRSARSPPLVEDRPNAVYYPTHVEGMKTIGVTRAGDYRVALTYSFPHRFWNVTGSNRTKVGIEGDDSVHLMATLWDPKSGRVVPNNTVTPTITKGGETVSAKPVWKMLSQNMGVHAGDNIALEGNGTYEIALDIGALQARTTGAFAEKFGRAEASFTFEYAKENVEEIRYERFPDKQGKRGAVPPMDMETVPVASTPAPDSLPGQLLGTPTSGDAVLATTALETPPAGVDGDGAYLAVSARTPYNGYPLPATGIAATHTRGGETLFDGPLEAAFDPKLGYHYGATTGGVESNDEVTLSVVTPPQLARHEGYETAFFDFEDVSLTVQ
ncbi:MAG: iron transporter [Haloarculaceae archaeon]